MFKTSASAFAVAGLTALFVTAMAIAADTSHAATPPAADGIVKVKSAYTFAETVDRLKKDVETKGIKFFSAVDQSELGSLTTAGLPLIKAENLFREAGPAVSIQTLAGSRGAIISPTAMPPSKWRPR